MPPMFSQSDRPDPNSVQGDRAIAPVPLLEIRICHHKTCRKDGAAQVFQSFLAQRSPDMSVMPAGCLGHCGNGPMVLVLPDQVRYSQVRSRDVAAIVAQHSSADCSKAFPAELGRSPSPEMIPNNSPLPPQKNFDDRSQPLPQTAVFWPYIALGLALLIALSSILGTALALV